jgi:flagellar protein FliS
MGKSPVDLVIQVYDGAIAAFNKASEHYNQQELNEGWEQLEKAKKFITHLYTTLDEEKGGEIAENLGKIYSFIINQTDTVEATKDIKLIKDNVKILQNLREGWVGAKEKMAAEPDEFVNSVPEPETSTQGFSTTG